LTALLYDAGRRLCESERVVVGYEAGAGESYGRLLIGGRAYDIVREARRGWRFSLMADGDESAVLSFLPSRLRRGGSICAGGAEVTLHPQPLGVHRWRFASTAGWLVNARMRSASRRGSREPEGVVDPVWPFATVELEGLDTVGASLETPLVLAFGCWLIVEAESQAFVDGGGGG
jgi:hypothetical protein